MKSLTAQEINTKSIEFRTRLVRMGAIILGDNAWKGMVELSEFLSVCAEIKDQDDLPPAGTPTFSEIIREGENAY